MPRLTLLLLALALLVPAPAALAQTDGFGPLPPPPPEPTPPPPPVQDPGGGDVGRGTMFLVGAGVLVVFFGIGWMITRDARRNLTESDRSALEREERGLGTAAERRKTSAKAKRQARQRTKAQKAARRHNRPR